jgi:uncharacterized membrane protein
MRFTYAVLLGLPVTGLLSGLVTFSSTVRVFCTDFVLNRVREWHHQLSVIHPHNDVLEVLTVDRLE